MGGVMTFHFDTALPLLGRTPGVLREMLIGLPEPWIVQTEGPGTWNAFDVVGHLIHGERTDWIPRVEHILAHGDSIPFAPFDRFGGFDASRGRSVEELLDIFAAARADSLARLGELRLSAADLERRGTHPEFGAVTLGQHLATWVVHDLDHLMQISRAMAQLYGEAVGPWRTYLRIVDAGVSRF
jgi:hypothetical protein